jgi:hypothetical protein
MDSKKEELGKEAEPMTLYEFKLLSLSEQAQTTWDDGVLLGFRQQEERHMILYQINNFYIEIQYHTEQNEIIDIVSFISAKPLKAYLDKIDISSLF